MSTYHQYPDAGKSLTLAEAVAVVAYEQELTFSTYKTLSEWLDCYTYILPQDRVISRDVYDLPIKPFPHSILTLYNYIQLLTCGFNLNQQNRIIGYIQCQQSIKAAQKVLKTPLSSLTQGFKTFPIPV